MKKKITFLLICIISGAAVYLFPQSQYRLEPVYIAVVGPMGQASGKAMRQGLVEAERVSYGKCFSIGEWPLRPGASAWSIKRINSSPSIFLLRKSSMDKAT